MHQLRRFVSDDFTMTKRQLGWLFLAVGCLILAGVVAAEIINTATNDFGTVQKLATLLGVLSVLAGVTLLPLGDRPA